jgi:hypothetical protein
MCNVVSINLKRVENKGLFETYHEQKTISLSFNQVENNRLLFFVSRFFCNERCQATNTDPIMKTRRRLKTSKSIFSFLLFQKIWITISLCKLNLKLLVTTSFCFSFFLFSALSQIDFQIVSGFCQ